MADDMTNSTASDGTKNPSVTPLSTGLTPSDYVIIGGSFITTDGCIVGAI